jgi:predicted ABC-type ATPase
MAKWMWIVAGPNGAGKSTFTDSLLANQTGRKLLKLNADERTLALRKQHPATALTDLNLRAAREIDAEVAASIDSGRSFLVETVLSTDKYRIAVRKAKAKRFKIGSLYVSLHPPELSPERVAVRVKKGGHAVDRTKAIERHARSHGQLRWFAAKADILAVYDNSRTDEPPIQIASCNGDQPLQAHAAGLNPAVDQALKIRRAKRRRKVASPK